MSGGDPQRFIAEDDEDYEVAAQLAQHSEQPVKDARYRTLVSDGDTWRVRDERE